MEGQPVIVKKVKKVVHGGHHGGSWKVAYADFVTAMMAFFLLMWLVTMVSPEKRAGVSYYFKHFNLFDKAGISFVDTKIPVKMSLVDDQRFGKPEIDEEGTELEEQRRKAFEDTLKQEIETRLADVKDQILVDTFENGVRVEIVEKSSSAMFPLGSAVMTDNGKRILKVIAGVLNGTDKKIAIEGHTDALAFSSSTYSNWELSTERASAARRELERDGFPPSRLMRVTGFADTQPLIQENASDPRNRRISILIFDEPRPVRVISPQEINIRQTIQNQPAR
ncbi:flagellar motor protein MotB [Desulfatirhabdium butyrativorans]|uniref:flagellar motor protein MotB n=1 Tax=Desulfatirhabdium butyrativorans TaxID=340467 RepID=UPI0004071B74|nr:flagellar motor protein MotB [Desulfatirhabdium butyrativorans]